MKRFFLAHSKSDDDQRISSLVSFAHDAVTKAAHGEAFQIMPGRDFYNARFKQCGSWEAWAEEAACGIDFATREPLFHGFLVPSVRVSAGTAKIIEKALATRKPCFVFRSDSTVARILAVRLADAGDWATGWALTIGQFT